jgi:hypothetical protein
VPVSVILIFEYERCACGLMLGDLVHTFSLLPGEQVRLFTSDKSTRWTFDKDTKLAYRHERTSSESHFTWGFARAVSDLTISESGSSETEYEDDWSQGGGGVSVDLFGIVELGGGGSGGSYSGESATEFARNLSQHAESSSSYVAASVRASRAVSVGEVETREHAQGESEEHFESATRSVRNDNYCHAVNYFVWQIMKCQRIHWRLVAIQTQVDDPAAPTGANVVRRLRTQLSVTPQTVLANSPQRLEVERMARESVIERVSGGARVVAGRQPLLAARAFALGASAIDDDTRRAALAAAQAELHKAGMVDKTGAPTSAIVAQLSWERQELLPTGGLMVKGCLDECNVCDEMRIMDVETQLENKRLQNELLKRQTELLDKHADYRCCPAGEEESGNGEE